MKSKVLSLISTCIIYGMLIVIFLLTSIDITAKKEEFISLGFNIIEERTNIGTRYEGGGTEDIFSPAGDVPVKIDRTVKNLSPLEKPLYKESMVTEKGSGKKDYSLSGELSRRKLFHFVKPEYPEGVNENTVVKLLISAKSDGSIASLEIIKTGGLRLDRSATSAIREWRFQPLASTVKDSIQSGVVTVYFRVK